MWKSKTTEQFIREARTIHGLKYDYSKVKYITAHEKVIITCAIHGEFIQEPNEHLKGCGCQECGYCSKKHKMPRSNKDEFIFLAQKVHNGFYTYNKTHYKNSKTNVIITCPLHGDFHQTPNAHLSRRGCPSCYKYYLSKGESDILNWLNNHNIKFERQKTFKTNPPFNKLRYDFYLPQHSTVIEFNGAQHYKPITMFGNEVGYRRQVNADNRKIMFCKNNNIKLIIISYKEQNRIDKILHNALN